MNPQFDKLPAMPMPQEAPDAAGVGVAVASPPSPEKLQDPGNRAPSPAPAAPAPASFSTPTSATPLTTPPVTPVSAAANDDDMNETALDQEWINKAKDIVNRTSDDPYIQSREISKARAGYIKLRYHKDIKVAEEQA